MEYAKPIVGYTAGAATTIAFLPQAIHVIKTGSIEDLSFGMFMIYFNGAALLIVYGILIHDNIIIMFESIAVVLNMIVLFYFIKKSKTQCFCIV